MGSTILLTVVSLSPLRAAETELPLTLAGCLARALARHPEVMVAQQRLEEATARVRERRGAERPQVDFTTTWFQYDWLLPNKEKILGGGTRDAISSVEARQLVFSSGRTGAQVAAARAGQSIAEAELRRTRQAIVFSVTRAYYAALAAQRLAAAQAEAVQQLQMHYDIAQGAFAVGKVAQVDVLRAEVQLANVRQAELKARNRLQVAWQDLHYAMGEDKDTPLTLAEEESPPPAPVSREAALQEAFAGHPEWVGSAEEIRRAAAEARASRAAARPSLSLAGQYYREGSGPSLNLHNWELGLQFQMPLYDAGISAAVAAQARAREQAATARRERLRQRIVQEVTDAVLTLDDALARLKVTEQAVALARQVLTIEQERYRVGMGSSTEVIDAQVALTQTEVNAIEALFDAKIAAAQVAYAVGREPPLALAQE